MNSVLTEGCTASRKSVLGSNSNIGSLVSERTLWLLALGPLGTLPDLLEKVDRAFSFGIYFQHYDLKKSV